MERLIIIAILLCASQAWAGDCNPRYIYVEQPFDQKTAPFKVIKGQEYIKKLVRYEIQEFDLTDKSVKAGVTYLVMAPDTKLIRLNFLLSEGWEIQEPYHGEDKVWLRRRVR